MKKVLILTVTAGNGHNACAHAMKKQLEHSGGVEVETVDIINEYSTPITRFNTDKGYCFAVSKAPNTYKLFYDKYRAANPDKRYTCSAQGAALSVVNGLYKKICEFKPDVIFCTHFYGAIALTDLKLAFNMPFKSITCCLDFVNSPFWEAAIGVDYITVPNADFIDEFVFEGFEKSKILPLGIPSNSVGGEDISKKEARQKIGLDEDAFTVLTMFGGGHWKGAYKLFKSVFKAVQGKRVQIIALNGSDKSSYKKIEKLRKKTDVKILNSGFTDNVPLYLSAADVAVTKCGGVSSCEMMNGGLPMVVTENIPAQEFYNLKYLKSKGAALSFKTKAELKHIFNEFFEKPEILEKMHESALSLKTNGLQDLAEFILNLPNADYNEFECEQIKPVKKKVKQAMRLAHRNEIKKNK